MSVTTDMTVTPIFDELAARLGLVWDMESTDINTADIDITGADAPEEPAEAETEPIAS